MPKDAVVLVVFSGQALLIRLPVTMDFVKEINRDM
jgi:hypothetical protein